MHMNEFILTNIISWYDVKICTIASALKNCSSLFLKNYWRKYDNFKKIWCPALFTET